MKLSVRCYRCFKETNLGETRYIETYDKDNMHTHGVILCPECYKELTDFLNAPLYDDLETEN